MKKFLALYMATKEQQAVWAKATPEEMEKDMAGWATWMEAHKDAWVDQGNPVGRGHKVDQSGANEAQNEVCGYGVVQAESMEAATAIFADGPHVAQPNSWVEVMPVVDMEM